MKNTLFDIDLTCSHGKWNHAFGFIIIESLSWREESFFKIAKVLNVLAFVRKSQQQFLMIQKNHWC
jgi:hypothetical protein